MLRMRGERKFGVVGGMGHLAQYLYCLERSIIIFGGVDHVVLSFATKKRYRSVKLELQRDRHCSFSAASTINRLAGFRWHTPQSEKRLRLVILRQYDERRESCEVEG